MSPDKLESSSRPDLGDTLTPVKPDRDTNSPVSLWHVPAVLPDLRPQSPGRFLQTPILDAAEPQTKLSGPEKVVKKESPVQGPIPASIIPEMNLPNLERLLKLKETLPLAMMERAVQAGADLLKSLKLPLYDSRDTKEAPRLIKSISDIVERSRPAKSVVCLVGTTGAGKSSITNAVLEEPRIVPTSCMRACTAVVTEIHYNYETDPSRTYRAEVEFIALEDWEQELECILGDLTDSSGKLSLDHSNPESEAGVAYAKIKAVYPQVCRTKEMIMQATKESLLSDESVTDLLGTVKNFGNATQAPFYNALREFLDSADKPAVQNGRRQMAVWPLIKVVRVYLRNKLLENGVVLVDLPGTQDSNAARSSLATKYMVQCSSVLIVAPIARAVDDKTAKTLLGNSFKLQLRMDGTYSNVAFICTKTDEISIAEASEGLEIQQQVAEAKAQSEARRLEFSTKSAELDALEANAKAARKTLDDMDAKVQVWEALEDNLAAGRVVYHPDRTIKRQRLTRRPRHRLRENQDVGSATKAEDANSTQEYQDRPLTSDIIKAELESLSSAYDKSFEDLRDMENRQKILGDCLTQQRQDMMDCEHRPTQICVQARNVFSRQRIKEDFALGIRELDEETALKENETAYDPEETTRDYTRVADSLPVFCVSSRAFQQLRGNSLGENHVVGFACLEDTGIPKLQEYIQQSAVVARIATCKEVLEDVHQILASLRRWILGDDVAPCVELTQDQKEYEMAQLKAMLSSLKQDMCLKPHEVIDTLNTILGKNIHSKLSSAIIAGMSSAQETSAGWALPKSMGGMAARTYQAVCRRDGDYMVKTKLGGAKSFNNELLEPFMKRISGSWEKTCARKLPAEIAVQLKSIGALLSQFQDKMAQRAAIRGLGGFANNLIKQQMAGHIRKIVNGPFRDKFILAQRTAHRQAVAKLKELMIPGYRECAAESGRGMFIRMKATMEDYLTENEERVFTEAAEAIKRSLDEAIEKLGASLTQTVTEVCSGVEHDYMAVFTGLPAIEGSEVALRLLRKLLTSADEPFAGVLKTMEPGFFKEQVTETKDTQEMMMQE